MASCDRALPVHSVEAGQEFSDLRAPRSPSKPEAVSRKQWVKSIITGVLELPLAMPQANVQGELLADHNSALIILG
jgi:hypothetical protein